MTTRTVAVPVGMLLVVASFTLSVRGLRLSTKLGIDKLGPAAQEIFPIAPEFRLTDITVNLLNLSDYQGEVVLPLDFWATWCTPCRWEVPDLVKLPGKYWASGLRVIGISLDDDAGPIRKFYKEFDMNYPVALGGVRVIRGSLLLHTAKYVNLNLILFPHELGSEALLREPWRLWGLTASAAVVE